MPYFDFSCDRHGTFEVWTRMGGSPQESSCPACGQRGIRIFSAPAAVRIQRGWNERANDYQRDAYTQARAQLTNVAREEAERSGGSPRPVQEESIQAAARQLADKRPRKSVVQKQIDLQRKLKREKLV